MHVVTFIGVVVPENHGWHYENPMTIRLPGDETTVIVIKGSIVNVRVLSPGDADSDDWLERLSYRTSSLVRASIDVMGFHLGASLDLKMLTGTLDNETTLFPAVAHQMLVGTVDGPYVSGELTAPYFGQAVADANFRHALADMRQATRLDDDSAFYSYRAIEDLRQSYVEDEDSGRSASWVRLRNELGLTREELRELQDAATARRHGDTQVLDPADTSTKVKFVDLARRLVIRYVTIRHPSLEQSAGPDSQT